jgi:seryl-tRNA synthetase
MKNDNNDMITKFKKIVEKNTDLTDIIIEIQNEKTELVDKIKQELSIITYKRVKNPKSIRLKKISGYFNKRDFKNIKLLYKTYLVIDLSNGDKINGKLSIYNDENENNINIKINNELVYDLDNKNFNNDILIEKIVNKYKEYLLKDYKKIR